MVRLNMLNPSGVEKSRPIMPMSTSAELGSVPAREGGRVSMLTRGSSTLAGGGGEDGGEGLDSRSARGREEGAPSMRSKRGVVDISMDRMMMGDGIKHIVFGCLL